MRAAPSGKEYAKRLEGEKRRELAAKGETGENGIAGGDESPAERPPAS